MKHSLPSDVQKGATAPVMVYSQSRRDEILAAVTGLGWRASASRRVAGLQGRILGSGADVLLVDGCVDTDASTSVAVIAPKLGRNGVAIVVMYPAGSDSALELVNAGATHLLSEPYSAAELQAVLISAKRYAARAMASSGVVWAPGEAGARAGLADSAELRRWLERNGQTETVWLLIVNISRFDAINEALGANAADAVLRAVGHRLPVGPARVGHALSAALRRMGGIHGHGRLLAAHSA